MPSDLETSAVRVSDDRVQSLPTDRVVHLEPSCAFRGPVGYDAARLLSGRDVMFLLAGVWASDVWPGNVHPRARYVSVLDGSPQVELAVRSKASGGSNRSNTRSQVQTRSAETQLSPALVRGVESVVVHAN